MLGLLLGASLALGEGLGVPETSYTGASILEGDTDVVFNDVLNAEYETDPNTYAFFEGNTLYVGNSDDYGNSVDGIIEFFWFQSSINRESDFYVAVMKVRATPGRDCPFWLSFDSDCELWADDLFDFGEYPVVSVEAITDVSREQGAFRWDWAVPFENYGIDAYGQISFSNQYGIGMNAEGSVMAHGEIPLDESGSTQAAGNVQVKGFLNPSFMVQTQYDITLYEWDVYVNGRADLMAWDAYLNLGERADQSAYYEYFLPIQVEIGEPFLMDELNFLATFDTGNINPFAHELGLSVQNVEISLPYWEEPEDEEEIPEEPSSEPSEEEIEEPEEEIEVEEPVEEYVEEPSNDEMPSLDPGEPVKSGCSTSDSEFSPLAFIMTCLIVLFRNED
tara:strand:- start:848 stop:2020 length:1173 start_codon:yes stop_codon:yes gene_type:complete